MSSVNQLESSLGAGEDATSHTPTSSALVGQAMIERAMSVIVVALRVDEDQAAQILLDAASEADISVRLAADQVMTALQADAGLHPGTDEHVVRNTLVRALRTVHPVDQPKNPFSPSVPQAVPRPA